MSGYGWATAAACVVPFWIGACALWHIGVRFGHDRYAFAGWSVMIGSLLTGVLAFAALWLGATVATLPWISLGFAVLIAVPRPWRGSESGASDTDQTDPSGDGQADSAGSRGSAVVLHLALAIGALVVLDKSLVANATLVTLGDEGNIWSGKAKAVVQADGFNDRLEPLLLDHFQVPSAYLWHTDYPPLNPMLQLLVFAGHGEITHFQNRVPIQMQAWALLLLLASCLRRVSRPWVAALGVLLFASSGLVAEVCRYAASDAMVALGLLAAVDALGRFQRSRDSSRRDSSCREPSGRYSAVRLDARYAWIAGAALAYLVWSKNEGWMLAVVIAIAALLSAFVRIEGATLRRGWPGARGAWVGSAAFLPALVLAVAQVAFNDRYGLKNDLTSPPDGPPLWSRIADQASAHTSVIAEYAWEYCVTNAGLTQWIFLMLLALSALFPLKVLRRAPLAAWTCAGSMFAFFLVYLGTPQPIEWHLSTSMERVLMQLLPLSAVLLASSVAAVFPRLASPIVADENPTHRAEVAR